MRGFAPYEHTRPGLKAALASQARYIEIDTRVSRDGKIFVYHDRATAPKLLGEQLVFAEHHSDKLDQLTYPDGSELLPLEELLELFAAHPADGKILCIDIKDFGFEAEHYALVARHNLLDRIIWVSWIPQSLAELHQLNPQVPLVLSHWNLSQTGWFGDRLTGLTRNSLRRIGGYVVIGSAAWNAPLQSLAHGYQHAYLATELPEELRQMLAASGGGICIHTSVLGEKLMGYCRESELLLMVFSVDDRAGYNRLSQQSGVDVIFCDAQIGRMLHEHAVKG